MIKVENIDVHGFKAAIRGMRNPMNSWDKSDTVMIPYEFCDDEEDFALSKVCGGVAPVIGDNDLDLMQRLYKAGTEHRKYLRMITVTMDITAPLYWWKEFDTYKVGTVANSCSTMHKIHEKEFTFEDFSCEHLYPASINCLSYTICQLNGCRELYLDSKDKADWWQMIQLLPSSYNQKRTVMMNYETVFNIIKQRTGHKVDEWNEFVDILLQLPYVKEIKNI